MIYIYTIGCPACNVLIKKIVQKDLQATLIQDQKTFDELNIDAFPMMRIDNGPLMNYQEALGWLKNQGGNK